MCSGGEGSKRRSRMDVRSVEGREGREDMGGSDVISGRGVDSRMETEDWRGMEV